MNDYTKWITRTAILLALTLVIQMLGFPQFITGPIINMMLFISTVLVGWLGGVLIGGLTPWIALVRGILLPPLAPMIPFIIVGNITLVILFFILKEKNYYLAILVASILKFAVLAVGVNVLTGLPSKVIRVMQLPQLLTALSGGLLAIFFLKILSNINNNLFNKQ